MKYLTENTNEIDKKLENEMSSEFRDEFHVAIKNKFFTHESKNEYLNQ